MMRSFVAACLGLATATAGATDLQFARTEDAIKYRQATFVVMAQHFARIGAMSRGRIPYEPRSALESAEAVATLAKLPWAGFGRATEKLSNSVKPELWTEAALFKEQNEKLVAESGKLVAAARTQNVESLKAAFNSTAATCKSCHDAYRTN